MTTTPTTRAATAPTPRRKILRAAIAALFAFELVVLALIAVLAAFVQIRAPGYRFELAPWSVAIAAGGLALVIASAARDFRKRGAAR